ncbi:MAG TPA: TIM barrel protein [Gaiellaceae bacterium]|nr:TIM barrel protein [Gaiellaceae bacterium]
MRPHPAEGKSHHPLTNGSSDDRASACRRCRRITDNGERDRHDHVKVGNLAGTPTDLPRIVEAFGELCADAANRTEAIVTYEFMPYDYVVNTLDNALAVVEGANAGNGGLAIDTWHLGKLGLEPEELRRIPPRFVSWVELSDGPFGIAEEWLDEVINRRRLPGEGEFPIREYVRVLRELGYRGPWGVEILSEELRNLPIEEIFDRAYATTMAQLDD